MFPGSTAQYWEFMREMGSFERFFKALAPDQHERVISEVLDAISQYDNGQQVNLSAVIVVATGVR
jgi:hypothetical protein